VGAAYSEELTTGNLTPSMGEFTASGGTSIGTGQGCSSGAYCTSGTQGEGGTYTSNFNVPLTEGEVKQGFTLNSGITINSHQSNTILGTCTDVMQSGDCKDIFKLTITLKDDGTAVETFTHQEELNWTGLKDFTYTDTVNANDYGVLTGVFSLFGIDAGYPYGFYGPQFSDPSLTIDYTTVLVQQQIETEIQQTVEQATQTEIIQVAELVVPTPTTTSSAPPPVNAPAGATTPTSTPDTQTTTTSTNAPPAAPSAPSAPVIAPVATTTEESSQQESQAEAEIEAELETQTETSTTETTEETTTESSDTSSGEPNTSSQPSESTVTAKTETSPKAKAKSTKTAKAKVRMSPAQAAQVVVSRIAPSQRYGANAQTVTMVAMGMIAQTGGLLKSKGLPDAVKFFKTTKIPDGPSLVDPLQNYVLFGTSNAAHDALVESQWRK